MKDYLLVLRFLVAPVSSWETEKKRRHQPADHEKSWFYPLLSIAGLSSFAQMLYGESLTMSLIRGIAMFSAFFIGYMLSPVFGAIVMKWVGTQKSLAVKETDLKILTMFAYSIGIMVAIVQNLLPTPLMPLYFFLVYLLFVLSKCSPMFGADTDEKKLKFVFGMFVALLVVPILVISIILKFGPQDVI